MMLVEEKENADSPVNCLIWSIHYMTISDNGARMLRKIVATIGDRQFTQLERFIAFFYYSTNLMGLKLFIAYKLIYMWSCTIFKDSFCIYL